MPEAMHSFESNSSNVPAFLIKLWKLVEDPQCDDLIAWSDSGYSFMIKDQSRFAKELLPQYFKHNNMASFIRQLNMYGFKKVMNYEKSGLKNESNDMEFQHGFFVKGQSELLELIKRKIANSKTSEPAAAKSNPKEILIDLTSIREKQDNMDNLLLKMKQENELLWRELANMRQKHVAQEKIIGKVIQFLLTMMPRNQNISVGMQRKLSRMIHNNPSKSSTSNSTVDILRKNSEGMMIPDQIQVVSPAGPVIHEVTDDVQSPGSIHGAKSPAPSVTIPNSPLNPSTSVGSATKSPINLFSILNTASNTPITMDQLKLLEFLSPKTQSTPPKQPQTSSQEYILGVPLLGMKATTDKDGADVISMPESSTVNNITIADENEDIGNVISIPEESAVNTPLSSASENPSNPTTPSPIEGLNSADIFNTSDINPFDALEETPSTSMNAANLLSPLRLSGFDDQLLSDSLQTPKVMCSEDEETGSVISRTMFDKSKSGKKAKASKSLQNKNSELFGQASQSPTKDSSSLVKNVLSNHLLSVDEKLNVAQDRLASNPWNIDIQSLLGLFSTDEVVNYDSLSSNLVDELGIKHETSDIIGNEVVQFNPNMLEVGLETASSFGELNPDDNTHTDFTFQPEALFADVLGETRASEAADFLTNEDILKESSPKRPKQAKATKTKRRKNT